MPIVFSKIGSTTTTVMVEAAATQVNTTDASLGNVIASEAIVELPMYARNIVGLLASQPGVTIFGSAGQGANGTNNLDSRSGSVNGGKSDQANVTLDGADVNDQNARTAFTTVLRVTPDSVEEFRSTTTNGDAATGRGSGADVALVTKSGTNQFHGSLYEFRRGTETAANSFFNNRSGVKIPFLLTNLFGGTVGGPIKKNKAFFFLNYEGRRDRSATSVSRIVPSATMQQGILLYHDANKVLQQVTPAQIKQLDPAGIGISAGRARAAERHAGRKRQHRRRRAEHHRLPFQRAGRIDQNTYIAKLDYKLDSVGKHSLFWRGNLQNDSANGSSPVPGTAAELGDSGQQQGLRRRLDGRVDPGSGEHLPLRFHPRGQPDDRRAHQSLRMVPRHRYSLRHHHRNDAHHSGPHHRQRSFLEPSRARFPFWRDRPSGLQPVLQPFELL